jgi:hypothetical protein
MQNCISFFLVCGILTCGWFAMDSDRHDRDI